MRGLDRGGLRMQCRCLLAILIFSVHGNLFAAKPTSTARNIKPVAWRAELKFAEFKSLRELPKAKQGRVLHQLRMMVIDFDRQPEIKEAGDSIDSVGKNELQSPGKYSRAGRWSFFELIEMNKAFAASVSSEPCLKAGWILDRDPQTGICPDAPKVYDENDSLSKPVCRRATEVLCNPLVYGWDACVASGPNETRDCEAKKIPPTAVLRVLNDGSAERIRRAEAAYNQLKTRLSSYCDSRPSSYKCAAVRARLVQIDQEIASNQNYATQALLPRNGSATEVAERPLPKVGQFGCNASLLIYDIRTATEQVEGLKQDSATLMSMAEAREFYCRRQTEGESDEAYVARMNAKVKQVIERVRASAASRVYHSTGYRLVSEKRDYENIVEKRLGNLAKCLKEVLDLRNPKPTLDDESFHIADLKTVVENGQSFQRLEWTQANGQRAWTPAPFNILSYILNERKVGKATMDLHLCNIVDQRAQGGAVEPTGDDGLRSTAK